MSVELNNDDARFLKERYPDLQILSEKPIKISGPFKIHAIYRDIELSATYDIEIFTSNQHIFPRIKETSERIKKLSEQRKIRIEELHINALDGTACLCSPIEEKLYEKRLLSFSEFIERYVVHFFYGQCFFEKYNKWPWGEYKHGIHGVLESYLDFIADKGTVLLTLKVIEEYCQNYHTNFNFFREQLRRKYIKGKNNCPICKSGKHWKECCVSAFNGLLKLKKDMCDLGIKI